MRSVGAKTSFGSAGVQKSSTALMQSPPSTMASLARLVRTCFVPAKLKPAPLKLKSKDEMHQVCIS